MLGEESLCECVDALDGANELWEIGVVLGRVAHVADEGVTLGQTEQADAHSLAYQPTVILAKRSIVGLRADL